MIRISERRSLRQYFQQWQKYQLPASIKFQVIQRQALPYLRSNISTEKKFKAVTGLKEKKGSLHVDNIDSQLKMTKPNNASRGNYNNGHEYSNVSRHNSYNNRYNSYNNRYNSKVPKSMELYEEGSHTKQNIGLIKMKNQYNAGKLEQKNNWNRMELHYIIKSALEEATIKQESMLRSIKLTEDP